MNKNSIKVSLEKNTKKSLKILENPRKLKMHQTLKRIP